MSFSIPRNRTLNPWVAFALNYKFGKLNVFGYHLAIVLIHFINGCLVYFLALMTFKLSSSLPSCSNKKHPIKQGDYRQAEISFSKALNIKPGYDDALKNIEALKHTVPKVAEQAND